MSCDDAYPWAEDWQTIQLTITTPHGLHARPAARFVQTAGAFDAQIWIKKTESAADPVPAASFNSIATLGINQGDQIVVFARGKQAREALTAIKTLINDQLPKLTEDFVPIPSADDAEAQADGAVAAMALSEGIAAGPLCQYRMRIAPIPRRSAQDCEAEWQQLLDARNQAS